MIIHLLEVWTTFVIAFAAGCLLGAALSALVARTGLAQAQFRAKEALAAASVHFRERFGRNSARQSPASSRQAAVRPLDALEDEPVWTVVERAIAAERSWQLGAAEPASAPASRVELEWDDEDDNALPQPLDLDEPLAEEDLTAVRLSDQALADEFEDATPRHLDQPLPEEDWVEAASNAATPETFDASNTPERDERRSTRADYAALPIDIEPGAGAGATVEEEAADSVWHERSSLALSPTVALEGPHSSEDASEGSMGEDLPLGPAVEDEPADPPSLSDTQVPDVDETPYAESSIGEQPIMPLRLPTPRRAIFSSPATPQRSNPTEIETPPDGSAAERRSGQDMRRPATLNAPRNGMPDDLQRIRGIGERNEQRLNNLGIFHFSQIAAWTPAEIGWIGTQLSFPERIERDDWVGQAIVLASGGETGFTKASQRRRARRGPSSGEPNSDQKSDDSP